MSELSPEARALIARERERSGPTRADRARLRARLDPAWAALRAGQTGAVAATPARSGLPLSRVLLSAAMLSLSLLPREAPHPAADDQPFEQAQQPTAPGGHTDSALAALADSTAHATAEPTAPAPGVKAFSERAPIDGHSHGDAERQQLHATRNALAKAPALARARAVHARHASTDASNAPEAGGREMRATDPSETAATELSAATDSSKTAALRAAQPLAARGAQPRAHPATTASSAKDQSTSDAPSEAPDLRAKAFIPEAIDDELSWLGAAQEALRRHEPTRALQLVQEHAFRFPRGALAQERRAVQLLALCELQRKQAARAVLREIEQRTPSSPLIVGIRRSCGL